MVITIRYDTYGFRDLGLDDAAEFVAEALGVTLSVRESSYRGVYYHAGGFGPPNLILSDNVRYRVWPNREGAVFNIESLRGREVLNRLVELAVALRGVGGQ